MIRKIFNFLVVVSAIVGFCIFVGGIGTMDFMVEQCIDYPMIETFKTCGIGMLLMLPVIVKKVVWG